MTTERVATGTLDLARARFLADSGEVHLLTTQEVALLAYLRDHAGQDVARDTLLGAVWGHHALSLSRAVDTTVTRLRRKLEVDPRTPEVLCTVHGHGYRLNLEGVAAALPAADVTRSAPSLVLGDREIDLASGVVTYGDRRLTLSAQERRLLGTLAVRPRQLVENDRLARLACVEGGVAALSNAVWRLRGKIEPDPAEPRWLIGVRGAGYRLDAEPYTRRADLDRVARTLWTLAGETANLAGLDDCVIYALDGQHLVQVAAHGPNKVVGQGILQNPITLRVGEGIVGTAARTRATQCIADVSGDPRYIADTVPARSELAVPIVLGDRTVGVIDSESPRLAAFDRSHRALFESMSKIAAAAVADVGMRLAS